MKKSALISAIGLAVAFLTSAALADEIEAIYIRANELYQNEQYEAAVKEYLKIRDLGYESWELYYNIGNAYYKTGDVARAILFYERARKLNPKNEDLEFNLQLANLSVVDRIPALPRLFFVTWVEALANALSLEMWGGLTLSLYLLLMAGILYRILARRGRSNRSVWVLSWGVAGLFLLAAAITSVRIYQEENRVEGIVLAPKVDVRAAPDETSTEMFTLHAGVKVQVQDETGEWLRIRLADGKVGWLKKDALEEI